MKQRKGIRMGKLLCYLILIIGGIISILPMMYMLGTSFRPNGALYEYPPRFFPGLNSITIENYIYVLTKEKFHINFINSAIVSVSTVILAAIIRHLWLFAGRFRFPEGPVFGIVIGTMIILEPP